MPTAYAVSAGMTGLLPLPIGGLAGWWNPRSLVLNNNDPIASEPNLFGSAGNLVQATGSLKPLYKTNLSPTGLPGISFDGIDDQLTATVPDFTNAAIIAFAGAIRAVNVGLVLEIEPNSATTNQGLMLIGNGTTKYKFRARPNTDFDDANGATVVTDAVWRRVICVLTGSGGTVQVFLNGVSDGSAAYTQDDIYTQAFLGVGVGPGGAATKLDMGELIVYTAYDVNRIAFLDNYLKAWTG